MCAAAWGYATVVKFLLDKGALPSTKDCLGATASDIAREKGEEEIALLLESYKTPEQKG